MWIREWAINYKGYMSTMWGCNKAVEGEGRRDWVAGQWSGVNLLPANFTNLG